MARKRTFREILEIKSDLNALDSSCYITHALIRDYRIKRKTQLLSVSDVVTKTYYYNGDKYIAEFFMIREGQIGMPREFFKLVVIPENGHIYSLVDTPLIVEDIFNLYRAYKSEMTYLYLAMKEEENNNEYKSN